MPSADRILTFVVRVVASSTGDCALWWSGSVRDARTKF